jgi:deoxyhypusine synthase
MIPRLKTLYHKEIKTMLKEKYGFKNLNMAPKFEKVVLNMGLVHKYAIQITVADSRDGACSSSTLKEASSWGKVDITKEQMVFAEATSVLPLIASDAYHKGEWKNREKKNFSKIF